MTIDSAGTRHPFTKLKPGMQVVISIAESFQRQGTLLAKHNGTKTLTVLYPDQAEPVSDIAYINYVGTPTPDPLDQIHPMLAKDISKRKTLSLEECIESPDWVMEEKYDGERQILTYVPGTNARHFRGSEWAVELNPSPSPNIAFRATTRVVGKNTGRLATNSKSITHLAAVPVPQRGPTVFDVELLHPDGFQTLRSIMGSLPDRAIELQREKGKVYAVVFDVLWFDGEDLRDRPFRERRSILRNWYETKMPPQDDAEYELYLSEVANTPEWKRNLLEDIQAQGGEGAMLKHVSGTYTDTTRSGRRSSDILKVKPFVEDDVVIYGFEQGKGEYNQHKFGAIRFAQWVERRGVTPDMEKNVLGGTDAMPLWYDHPMFLTDGVLVHMGTCSGITDEQEAMFRADPDSFIGQVMEVRYQQRWDDTGLMRHPNFVRLRSDKSPVECVYGRDA